MITGATTTAMSAAKNVDGCSMWIWNTFPVWKKESVIPTAFRSPATISFSGVFALTAGRACNSARIRAQIPVNIDVKEYIYEKHYNIGPAIRTSILWIQG